MSESNPPEPSLESIDRALFELRHLPAAVSAVHFKLQSLLSNSKLIELHVNTLTDLVHQLIEVTEGMRSELHQLSLTLTERPTMPAPEKVTK